MSNKKDKTAREILLKRRLCLTYELYYSKSDLSTGKFFTLFNFLNSLRIKAKVRIPVNASVIAADQSIYLTDPVQSPSNVMAGTKKTTSLATERAIDLNDAPMDCRKIEFALIRQVKSTVTR